ncbi:hypothetical protein Kpol_467p4 [Vanderwaltozyma polyspora DSM 70294]|uniref:Ran-specific GTPase-activating protein 30 n=1 Tax=Vanderwaltozyma polyspora (strain ATCC 22028 / DSM 70294 / BCRC 21397 / CBS 2163 / NBRC 10782 / NRRL Y-8283 / UCD 57-17) TaxID=436907 RepID=A7TQE8_VANPO|nr:uncharacterized protein Kpol_467p4 [Vanderwaltozyma polyspora DSM 70294]EDO15492.1 hypothetical protein Kpol_467p4 [Vanderwaltozyma polyspora DSM 70294]
MNVDDVLARAGSQAVSFAIKSGVSLVSSYALKTLTNLVINLPKDDKEDDEDLKRLENLKKKLETRVAIVSSTIELIKLVAARGNTNLENVITLTSELKREIDNMDERLRLLADQAENSKKQDLNSGKKVIAKIESYIKDVLNRIDEVTPFLNLSLTTSGANLSTSLPKQISPNLLLQSSNYINTNNSLFKGTKKSIDKLQVGPTFQVTLFSVFYKMGGNQNIFWKEDMRRADVKLFRIKDEKLEYNYIIRIEQNFEDTRYHDDDEKRHIIELKIPQIVKLFFSVSGKLLNLEEMDTPVLVLKIDKNIETTGNISSTEDIVWYALGGYEEIETSSENEESDTEEESFKSVDEDNTEVENVSLSIKLLEFIIRLASLQLNDQKDILGIKDERLSLYLNDENPNSIRDVNVNKVAEKLHKIKLQDDK